MRSGWSWRYDGVMGVWRWLGRLGRQVRGQWWSVGIALLGGAVLLVGLIARLVASTPPTSAAWREDLRADRDRDGVPDLVEVGWYGSDPSELDTDGDGLPDGF